MKSGFASMSHKPEKHTHSVLLSKDTIAQSGSYDSIQTVKSIRSFVLLKTGLSRLSPNVPKYTVLSLVLLSTAITLVQGLAVPMAIIANLVSGY